MPPLVAEFLHNVVAHPLLFWTREARWAVRLHDATALAAWPDGKTTVDVVVLSPDPDRVATAFARDLSAMRAGTPQ